MLKIFCLIFSIKEMVKTSKIKQQMQGLKYGVYRYFHVFSNNIFKFTFYKNIHNATSVDKILFSRENSKDKCSHGPRGPAV